MSTAPGIMPPPAGVQPNAAPAAMPPPAAAPDQSTATQQSAYVAPTSGQPTICQNCAHFDGQGSCDAAEVIADPDVMGQVDPNGHSKFYTPKTDNDGDEPGASPEPQYSKGAASLAAGARFPKARPNVGV